MKKLWKTRMVMSVLLIIGLAVWVGFSVERDGRALVMACLHEEGDASVLDGIRLSGVLVDRDARQPFAQGFVATGPGLQVEEAWQRRIQRTEYRNSSEFRLAQALLSDIYEYRLQVVTQPDAEKDPAILVTRTAETGGSETAMLEGVFGAWRLDDLQFETMSTPAVLEAGEATYLLLPLDSHGDSWIYRIDAWGPERDRVKADDRLLAPLAVVPRTLGNRLVGFFQDGDALLVVAAEDPVYASGTVDRPVVDERVLLYRFGLDGSPVDQTILPTGTGTLADVACADGMLFVTMLRYADGTESGSRHCEVCVYTMGTKPEPWGEIPLDHLYMPLDLAIHEYEDRAYRVIDGRLVFAWSALLNPVRQSNSNTWVYPDGSTVYDNGGGQPMRQAIQLMVYERSGKMTYRGLFDPGLSQDYQLLRNSVGGTARDLARLRLDRVGP